MFSFHATKFVNSFEGGAIATNDGDLAERLQLMRNFGFAGYDKVAHIGTNGKLAEVAAAMGLTSLESIDKFVETNRRNYNQYRTRLSQIDGFSVYDHQPANDPNYQYVVVEVDSNHGGLTRYALVEVLWAENIFARRYFHPGIHQMEPYRSFAQPPVLAVTDRLCREVLVLPSGQAVSAEDVHVVCDVIELAASQKGTPG